MVSQDKRDMVRAILGGSAALTILVLVFLVLIVAVVRSSASGTGPPSAVARGYRIVSGVAGGALVFGLSAFALCVWWYNLHYDSRARKVSVGLFVLELLLFVGAAVAALILLAWKDHGSDLSAGFRERLEAIDTKEMVESRLGD